MSPPAGGAAAGAAAGALAASAEDSIVAWPDSTTSVTRRALMTDFSVMLKLPAETALFCKSIGFGIAQRNR